MKAYTGPLDILKMEPQVKRAYWVWSAQRKRTKRDFGKCSVVYSSREFIAWYRHHLPRFKKLNPGRRERIDVGRIDHTKGYYFGNIQFEFAGDNVSERNIRHGNPNNKHKKVVAQCPPLRGIWLFNTMGEAAAYFKVSEKTVYNHCTGRTKKPFSCGPKSGSSVRFRWA